MPSASELKESGNAALSKGRVREAIDLYTAAIELEPDNHVLYSNRSAAYCKWEDFDKALEDAEKCNSLEPKWAKGWQRRATALEFQGRFAEAVIAYDEGLKHDEDNITLKEGRRNAMRNADKNEKGYPNMFGFPDLWDKLEKDPRTLELLQDADYRKLIHSLQERPNDIVNHLSDSRIVTTLQALMGMEGAQEAPPSNSRKSKETSPPAAEQPKENSSTKSSPKSELSEQQQRALSLKNKGNESYKKKDFDEALRLYAAAFDEDSSNMSLLSNQAAVHFEKGDFDACIAKCEEAVDVGRANRADFKLIAKALARIGNAHVKLGDNAAALKFYQKSLSEHRSTDVVKKVQQMEKNMKDEAARAYIDPVLAEEERLKGNEFFTKGDYPNAVKSYTEALHRNPDDSKIYSNRAAAYSKLMEFSLALKDCDRCIEIDPDFIKGYIRKGHVCLALKNPTKAAEAFKKAVNIDSTNVEAMEGYRNATRAVDSDPEAVRERAIQDPDVQSILSDPAMQLILEQMQQEPESARDHLRDPNVASKLKKLMEVGLVTMR